MDTTAARRQAARLMQADPSLSLREVAKATGISPGTVRDVRQRILNGKPPELIRPTSASERAPDDSDRRRRITGGDLRADSALQATAQGRELVDWFGSRAITEDEWRPFVTAVPKSRVYLVAQAARTCAETWSNFADSLEALFRRRG
jgi:Winged helix-turn-helix DNA-binding